MEGEPLQWPRLYVARSEDIECGHEVLLCAQRVGSRRSGLADILLVGPRRLARYLGRVASAWILSSFGVIWI